MARDYTQFSPERIRRKDRAVEDEQWIKTFLQKAPFGTIAMISNGVPMVNSNIFYYDEEKHAIYFHTAREGRTRSNIEKNPRVCFSISRMGRLLPAERALNFSVEYSGVTVFGKCKVVEKEEEARHFLQLLCNKYFPHLKPEKDYAIPNPEEMNRTTTFKISIDQWSAKQKKVEPDFPGAFFYAEP